MRIYKLTVICDKPTGHFKLTTVADNEPTQWTFKDIPLSHQNLADAEDAALKASMIAGVDKVRITLIHEDSMDVYRNGVKS